MYIELDEWTEHEQKELYAVLSRALNAESGNFFNEKISGLYAIFKDNTCLYVGQSINLASRISTHLRGKYKSSDNILLFDIRELGFDDFKERKKEDREAILTNSEKQLMSLLKPTENLDIDMDFKPNKRETVEFCHNYNKEERKLNSTFEITITKDGDYLSDNIMIINGSGFSGIFDFKSDRDSAFKNQLIPREQDSIKVEVEFMEAYPYDN